MCHLNVIVMLHFICRDLYLLFAIFFSSKYQNSIFYQHMRPKSGLKSPRPLTSLPYELYKQKLLAWREVTDLSKDKQGVAIALSLPEEDKTKIQEISTNF